MEVMELQTQLGKELLSLTNKTPNDAILGNKVRELVREYGQTCDFDKPSYGQSFELFIDSVWYNSQSNRWMLFGEKLGWRTGVISPSEDDSMLGCFTISDEHDNPIWYCEIVGGDDVVPTVYYNPYYRTLDGTGYLFDSTTSFWTNIQETKNDLIEIDMFVKEANKRLNSCK
jgi:hypothetical protein